MNCCISENSADAQTIKELEGVFVDVDNIYNATNMEEKRIKNSIVSIFSATSHSINIFKFFFYYCFCY